MNIEKTTNPSSGYSLTPEIMQAPEFAQDVGPNTFVDDASLPCDFVPGPAVFAGPAVFRAISAAAYLTVQKVISQEAPEPEAVNLIRRLIEIFGAEGVNGLPGRTKEALINRESYLRQFDGDLRPDYRVMIAERLVSKEFRSIKDIYAFLNRCEQLIYKKKGKEREEAIDIIKRLRELCDERLKKIIHVTSRLFSAEMSGEAFSRAMKVLLTVEEEMILVSPDAGRQHILKTLKEAKKGLKKFFDVLLEEGRIEDAAAFVFLTMNSTCDFLEEVFETRAGLIFEMGADIPVTEENRLATIIRNLDKFLFSGKLSLLNNAAILQQKFAEKKEYRLAQSFFMRLGEHSLRRLDSIKRAVPDAELMNTFFEDAAGFYLYSMRNSILFGGRDLLIAGFSGYTKALNGISGKPRREAIMCIDSFEIELALKERIAATNGANGTNGKNGKNGALSLELAQLYYGKGYLAEARRFFEIAAVEFDKGENWGEEFAAWNKCCEIYGRLANPGSGMQGNGGDALAEVERKREIAGKKAEVQQKLEDLYRLQKALGSKSDLNIFKASQQLFDEVVGGLQTLRAMNPEDGRFRDKLVEAYETEILLLEGHKFTDLEQKKLEELYLFYKEAGDKTNALKTKLRIALLLEGEGRLDEDWFREQNLQEKVLGLDSGEVGAEGLEETIRMLNAFRRNVPEGMTAGEIDKLSIAVWLRAVEKNKEIYRQNGTDEARRKYRKIAQAAKCDLVKRLQGLKDNPELRAILSTGLAEIVSAEANTYIDEGDSIRAIKIILDTMRDTNVDSAGQDALFGKIVQCIAKEIREVWKVEMRLLDNKALSKRVPAELMKDVVDLTLRWLRILKNCEIVLNEYQRDEILNLKSLVLLRAYFNVTAVSSMIGVVPGFSFKEFRKAALIFGRVRTRTAYEYIRIFPQKNGKRFSVMTEFDDRVERQGLIFIWNTVLSDAERKEIITVAERRGDNFYEGVPTSWFVAQGLAKRGMYSVSLRIAGFRATEFNRQGLNKWDFLAKEMEEIK